MGILFVLAFLIIPYLTGCLVNAIFKESGASHLNTYVTGILTVFLYSLFAILVSLKLDKDLKGLTIILMAGLGVLAIAGIFFAVRRIKKGLFKLKPGFDKKSLFVLVPAFVIGLVSIVFLNQDYCNDATIETVRTTLDTGRLYSAASLDGAYMVNGLPIFNKIFVIPMLYAVLSKITFTDISLITGLIIPIITYTLNMLLMYEIAVRVTSDKSRNLFMYSHMLVLISGTFIPAIAIPVSAGFVLLRQGYTGYTWAYCVLAPFVAINILDKKYIKAVFSFAPIVGLLKLDSIYFAFKDFSNSYHSVGEGGKLWIVYLLAVIYFIYVAIELKRKYPAGLLIAGSGLISAAITDLYERLSDYTKKKEMRYSFLAWMAVALLACASFYPYKGASFSLSLNGATKAEKTAFDVLTDWRESEFPGDKLVFFGPDELMSKVRLYTTKVRPAYGRDFIEPLLTGYNYEYPEQGQEALVTIIEGLDSNYKEFTEKDILEAMIENESLMYTDVIVLRSDTVVTDAIWDKLTQYGFIRDNIKIKKEYQYIHK